MISRLSTSHGKSKAKWICIGARICTQRSIQLKTFINPPLQLVPFWNMLIHQLKPFKWMVLNGMMAVHTVGSPMVVQLVQNPMRIVLSGASSKGVDRYWKVGGTGEQVLIIPYIIFTHTITFTFRFCVTCLLAYFLFDKEASYRGW